MCRQLFIFLRHTKNSSQTKRLFFFFLHNCFINIEPKKLFLRSFFIVLPQSSTNIQDGYFAFPKRSEQKWLILINLTVNTSKSDKITVCIFLKNNISSIKLHSIQYSVISCYSILYLPRVNCLLLIWLHPKINLLLFVFIFYVL